jgi:aminoglycoside phosphotransferase (APT) family kinase protein
MELLWMQPVGIASRPSSPTIDQFIAHYEAISGIAVPNRPWYRAFQAFKMAVILLVGSPSTNWVSVASSRPGR